MKTTPQRDTNVFKPENYPLQTFSEEAWQFFTQLCEELEIELTPKCRTIFEKIYSHLLGVNEWMNLTRITADKEYLKLHILDSLTALDFVDEFTNGGDIVVDLGSGGGYPGLPLMTLLPSLRWVLVDSRQKKVNFLKAAIPLTECRLATAESFRGNEVAKACPELAGQAAVVISRAVGRVDDLLDEAAPILKPGGVFIVLKGPAYIEDERHAVEDVAESKGFDLTLDYEVRLEENDPPRHIVVLTRLETQEEHLPPKSKPKKKKK